MAWPTQGRPRADPGLIRRFRGEIEDRTKRNRRAEHPAAPEQPEAESMRKEKSMAVEGSFMEGYVANASRLKDRLLARLRPRPLPWHLPNRFAGNDIPKDIRTKYHFEGDILDFFANNKGPAVHKWHQYIPIYDRYFSKYRNGPVRFLEIGVQNGGSLQMWRKYFGPDARIGGIDIDPKCIELDGQVGMVRIGSQEDPEFLRSVVEELGGVDIVLDDGSHLMPHMRASLRILFPLLSDGGLYMVEDVHCAYMRRYGGGTRSKANFLNHVREIIDDMHRWYHPIPPHVPELDRIVSGIHVHDSIVVFEKDSVHPPVHSIVGERRGGH